ncbi:MAG TPA: hypothetical protein VJG67_02135 [Candidatus Paceibacterota bacterium]
MKPVRLHIIVLIGLAIFVLLFLGVKTAFGQEAPKELSVAKLRSAKVATDDAVREAGIKARAAEIALAEAKKKADKTAHESESEAMKKARKEADKADEYRAKEAKLMAKARGASGITGALGCEAKDIELTSAYAQMLNQGRGMGRVTATVTAVNSGSDPVMITTSYNKGIGPVVKNLCPGGTVTLSFSRQVLSERDRRRTLRVPLTAISIAGNGTVTTRSFEMTLSGYAWEYEPQVNYPVWDIR